MTMQAVGVGGGEKELSLGPDPRYVMHDDTLYYTL